MQVNVTFDPAKRHRTATHEACHAVVIHACGLVVDHVQLTGESSGFTDPAEDEGAELPRCDKLRALGAAVVAGNIGVEVMLGAGAAAAERNDGASSTRSDDSKADGFAQAMIGECNLQSDVPTSVAAFRERARQVLSTSDAQQAVQRVRDALLASTNGALCRSRVRRAIEGVVEDDAGACERKADDLLGS